MKVLTANFLTCAVKTCKQSVTSFPLHFKDVELQQIEVDFGASFLISVLGRVEWEALKTNAVELGFTNLPAERPDLMRIEISTAAAPGQDLSAIDETQRQLMHELHVLLIETEIVSGLLICGNCGHEYRIKEGVANFLLPSHLV